MKIRLLTPSDVPSAAALYLAQMRYAVCSVSDAYRRAGAQPDEGAAMKRYTEMLSDVAAGEDPSRLLFVAVEDGQVVGFVDGRLAGASLPAGLYSHLQVGYLALAHVQSEWRRKGVVRSLESALLQALGDRNCHTCELDYFITNQLAMHTWPRLGYSVFAADLRKDLRALNPGMSKPSSPLPFIRQMQPSDLCVVSSLYAELTTRRTRLQDTYIVGSARYPDDVLLESLQKHMKCHASLALVAEWNGHIAGFMLAELVSCPVPVYMAAVDQVCTVVDAHISSHIAPEIAQTIFECMEASLAARVSGAGIRYIQNLKVFSADKDEQARWSGCGYQVFTLRARKRVCVEIGLSS